MQCLIADIRKTQNLSTALSGLINWRLSWMFAATWQSEVTSPQQSITLLRRSFVSLLISTSVSWNLPPVSFSAAQRRTNSPGPLQTANMLPQEEWSLHRGGKPVLTECTFSLQRRWEVWEEPLRQSLVGLCLVICSDQHYWGIPYVQKIVSILSVPVDKFDKWMYPCKHTIKI